MISYSEKSISCLKLGEKKEQQIILKARDAYGHIYGILQYPDCNPFFTSRTTTHWFFFLEYKTKRVSIILYLVKTWNVSACYSLVKKLTSALTIYRVDYFTSVENLTRVHVWWICYLYPPFYLWCNLTNVNLFSSGEIWPKFKVILREKFDKNLSCVQRFISGENLTRV